MAFTRTATIVLATTALALGACAKKAPKTLPPDPVGTETTTGGGGMTTPGAATPGSPEDFVASVTGDRIFFALDEFAVDAQDQATLQSQAEWLRRYPAVTAVIEGHADERGTRDYNLALGERRANAAKNYLASLGIDPSRLQVISYGKERPAALGSDEAAWAQNRRAVTVTIRR